MMMMMMMIMMIASAEYPLGMNAYLSGMSVKRTLPKFGGGHHDEYEDTILWDVITWSQVEARGRFGGMYCLHIQDLKVIKANS
jgi:hypothetical protein